MKIGKILTKEGLSRAFKSIKGSAKDNAPTLMILGATFGVGLTVYEALKAKPKYDDILADRKKDIEALKNQEKETETDEEAEVEGEEASESKPEEKLSDDEIKKEITKINVNAAIRIMMASWKLAGAAGGTILLMWMANKAHLGRLQAATAIADLSAETLGLYKKKNKEVLGEEKAKEVDEAVAQERFDKATLDYDDFPEPEGGEGYRIFDMETGHFFRSSMHQIELAEEKLLRDIERQNDDEESFRSLRQFYDQVAPGQITYSSIDDLIGFDVHTPPHFELGWVVIEATGERIPTISYSWTRSYSYSRFMGTGTYRHY